MVSAAIDDGLPAVVARNVGKTFRVPEQRISTLKERALHPRRQIGHRSFRVLDGISFAIKRGEFFGIVGRNGSGKSTLLKCIAGIYSSEGDIWCRGRLAPFIELGVGFNPELAARDNVVMNGIMMGLTPRQARKRYESVIEFAELKEFEDLKLKNYSSGMHVRLAFSVAIQVDADILLIDEVFAVGDASFQQKCFDVLNEMRDAGKTMVFVTHDMGTMRRFCHRSLLLEQGQIVLLGDPQQVGDRYLAINFGRDQDAVGSVKDDDADQGEARVLEAWVENEHGQRQEAVAQGQRITLNARVVFNVQVEDPDATVYVLNDEHKAILVASTTTSLERSGCFYAGEQVVFAYSFENVLGPGRYSPMFTLARGGMGLDVIDRFEGSFSFVVTAVQPQGGAIDLPVKVSVRRQPGASPEISSAGLSDLSVTRVRT
jgi:ABC-type polysaccharide/polyol phosphate transport system ATPase subunit